MPRFKSILNPEEPTSPSPPTSAGYRDCRPHSELPESPYSAYSRRSMSPTYSQSEDPESEFSEIQDPTYERIVFSNDTFQVPTGHRPHPNCPDDLDCLIDTNERPQYTLDVITRCAILGSPKKRLTLRGIYEAMEKKYPYYRTAGNSWRTSVRHQLSLKNLFERQPKPAYEPGFGSYWTVNLSAPPGTKRPRKRGPKSYRRKNAPPTETEELPLRGPSRMYFAGQPHSPGDVAIKLESPAELNLPQEPRGSGLFGDRFSFSPWLHISHTARRNLPQPEFDPDPYLELNPRRQRKGEMDDSEYTLDPRLESLELRPRRPRQVALDRGSDARVELLPPIATLKLPMPAPRPELSSQGKWRGCINYA